MENLQTNANAGIDAMAAHKVDTSGTDIAAANAAAGASTTGVEDRAAGSVFGVDAMTGTADPIYDLVSVLYHALQGAEASMIYAGDAAYDDDTELAQFFEEIQDQDCRRAERAKQLLRRYLNEHA